MSPSLIHASARVTQTGVVLHERFNRLGRHCRRFTGKPLCGGMHDLGLLPLINMPSLRKRMRLAAAFRFNETIPTHRTP